MTTAVLETRDLTKSFGALAVTSHVSLSLPRGARHALIGPNGAGKTTLINLITGVLAPSSGDVLIDGVPITALSPATRVKRGIARTFQITSLFRNFTVLDTVALSVAERMGIGWHMWRSARSHGAVRAECMALLDRLGLADEAGKRVADLAYGKQRLVEIAVALGLRPRVLLLDEPAAGVPSMESGRILEVLAELPDDITILMIEHDMDLVARFAERITVLVAGSVLMEGTPQTVLADERVRAVYLGEAAHG
jgi:ABC-type branched-subunit amino acid transport system ATPase component